MTSHDDGAADFVLDQLRGALSSMVPGGQAGIPFGGSFTRKEANSFANWFVDGKDMMHHAADMMEVAREEIFITDWWLSPQVHLKRPNIMGNHWRLDNLLKRKAEEGVKVYVLLYKEVSFALGLKSLASKRHLQALHPNIMVIRHPDHLSLSNSTVWWSHHEKLLIVDQNIAFIGGLDFAYGRWDDPVHRLTDVGSVRVAKDHHLRQGDKGLTAGLRGIALGAPGLAMPSMACADDGSSGDEAPPPPSPEQSRGATKWRKMKATVATGLHSSSSRRRRAASLETRSRQPLPSDGEDSDSEPGELSRARELIAARLDRMQDHIPNLSQGFKRWRRKKVQRRSSEAIDYNLHIQTTLDRLKKEFPSNQPLAGAKLWIGKDYINFIFKNFEDLDKPDQDFVDRALTPRMPWHDVHSVVYGAPARDLARHFATRWNAAKEEKTKLITYPHLLPKVGPWPVPDVLKRIATPCNIQILRSISSWSLPALSVTEASIHQAYIHLIANAEHFIYIENQFFVSLIEPTDSTQPLNKVASALCERILKAHKAGAAFRVYVVIPLLPNFQGELGKRSGNSLQPILHLTYASICRGRHSLLETLERKGVYDPSKYVIFCGLRNWGLLGGRPVSELIYIHTKLMIVDDRAAIIGSANINDRSLLGNRDSEMGALIEDSELHSVRFAGAEARVGRFCRALRLQLFREHLGLLPEQRRPDQGPSVLDVSDPVRPEFFDTWRRLATENTQIFEKVFHCLPSDEVRSFADIPAYTAQIRPADYAPVSHSITAELHKIQGHLVLYPLSFLADSNLEPSVTSKEGMVPPIVFT